jgi:release factor glutamine methyltransferase
VKDLENYLDYRGLKLQITPEIYTPQEDTDLCADWLDEWAHLSHSSPKILEIGCGPGTLILYLTKCLLNQYKTPSLIGTDIDSQAISAAQFNANLNGYSSYIRFYQGNLFTPLPFGQFDLIYFNPPYLPGEEDIIQPSNRRPSDVTWEGGPTGDEVIIEFLGSLSPFLKSSGQFMFISSSLVDQHRILKIIKKNRLKLNNPRKKHFFFEDIILYSGEK